MTAVAGGPGPTTATTQVVDPRVYEQRWRILTFLCLSLTMVVAANSSLNVAIPSMIRALRARPNQISWILDAYGLVFAGFLLVAGALADRFGRRRSLRFGLLMFGLSSLAAAFATSANQLIAMRAVLGFSAAFIMPATLSIITRIFPTKERAKAIAVWAGFAGAGASIGPIVTGLLLTHFGWSACFSVNVVLSVITLAAGWRMIPESSDPKEAKLDPVGSLISMLGFGSLLYGIIEGPEHGWTSAATVGVLAFALVALTAFVQWELRSTHPMLDVRLFRSPRMAAGSITIMLGFMVNFGLFLLFSQYNQQVRGWSPLASGFANLPFALMVVTVAPRGARFVERFGVRKVISIGRWITAVGFACVLGTAVNGGYAWFFAGLVLGGFGVAISNSPATALIMSAVPPAKSGVGSAVNDTVREVGGSLGIAVMSSIASSAYRSNVTSSVRGLPVALRDPVRESLGTVLRLRDRIPPNTVLAAKRAWVHGFHVALVVAIAISVTAGAAVNRMLRNQQ